MTISGNVTWIGHDNFQQCPAEAGLSRIYDDQLLTIYLLPNILINDVFKLDWYSNVLIEWNGRCIVKLDVENKINCNIILIDFNLTILIK